MILAIDVHYGDTEATVAAVQADEYLSVEPTQTFVLKTQAVSEYEPGQFYRRELPCIVELLDHYELKPSAIFVDGFVYLGGDMRAGLGKHLFDALEGGTVVIGVAKSPFRGVSKSSETYRGGSKRPLYVTAAGISQDRAKKIVEKMAGAHRIPTLLKLADSAARADF